MTDTEAQMQGVVARNEAAKRGAYPGDIHAGFRLLRRDVDFLIEQNAELRRDKERLEFSLAIDAAKEKK